MTDQEREKLCDVAIAILKKYRAGEGITVGEWQSVTIDIPHIMVKERDNQYLLDAIVCPSTKLTHITEP